MLAQQLAPRTLPPANPRTSRPGSYYSRNDLERLIEGYVFDEDRASWRAAGGSNPSDDGSYLLIRSRMEERGHVDSIEFTEMLDVERAVGELREHHPISAMLLVLVMMGWQPQELDRLFGGKLHTPAGRHFDRGIAWCQAWLNGEDPEPAYRGARPRELSGSK